MQACFLFKGAALHLETCHAMKHRLQHTILGFLSHVLHCMWHFIGFHRHHHCCFLNMLCFRLFFCARKCCAKRAVRSSATQTFSTDMNCNCLILTYPTHLLAWFIPVPAGLFSVLEGATLDPETHRAIKRRLNPLVDLAAAAEDKITPDGYGLAHNAARSDAVSGGCIHKFHTFSKFAGYNW
jgi:hypothetical protein